MREIKFRAWSNERRCYEYNVGLNDGKPVRKGYQWFNTDNDVHNAKPEQFTNLYDKNGKEIYEGDVVRDGFDTVRTVKWFDYLGYDGGGATHSGFYFDETYDGVGELNYHNHMTDCEIIGNIHENPELLNAH